MATGAPMSRRGSRPRRRGRQQRGQQRWWWWGARTAKGVIFVVARVDGDMLMHELLLHQVQLQHPVHRSRR